ncbi:MULTISPECIES: hypothetical protein [unclassified Curtobacterium]|uniref:hypothetical protein n=1 Tax=unclassified Curtobacterium TaxID=257496 RepID=UPI003A7F6981
MAFEDRLKAATKRVEEKGRPSKIVTVTLDSEVSDKLQELEARLEDEKQKPQDGRLAKKSPIALLLEEIEQVKAEFEGTLVDLKFTRMLGPDWGDITIVNPPRDDSLPDRVVFGYNFHAVTRLAAIRSGKLLEDGEEKTLTEDQWNELFALLSGKDHENVANAVYTLNEGDTNRAVEVGKALRAATHDSETKSD